MRKWKRLFAVGLTLAVALLAVAVVAALALPPAAPAAPAVPPDLNWQVVASGGATMSSASYTLYSTSGQPVAGPTGNANYSLLSGYWYGFQEFLRTILLPVILAD